MSSVEFDRYDTYEDSGVEWFGDIPRHWKISHLKRFCKKITDGAHTSPDLLSNDYPFLTVVNLNNGKLDFDNCLFTSYVDYEKLVRNGCQPKKNDVLYSKDGTISETAVIDEDRNFVVGSSFIIVRPNLKISNPAYLCYFLTSPIMRYQAQIYVKGASLPRISIFNITKLISIVPSLPEQQTIAVYLDTKTANIDRQIDLLTQKATQYAKLKQSLINVSVTRGLDKTVAMKDSGVEWIGEVPAHWEVRRIKDLFVESKARSTTGDELLLSVSEYTGVTQKHDNVGEDKFVSRAESLVGYKICKVGDIVINIMLAWKRGLGVSPFYGIVSPSYAVYVPLNMVNSAFFHYLLRAEDAIAEFKRNSTGIIESRLRLYADSFYALSVAVPSFEEQRVIANYLDEKTAHIDSIIQTINTQIGKLKELRKTLINDVVTGKIKVV
ncbi:MAG: restriction endonuclease subunit S [Pseudomonadota bacterium]